MTLQETDNSRIVYDLGILKILGPYSVVSDIVFSPDSEQISYVAEIVNGKAYLYYGTYLGIWPLRV